MTKHVPPKGLIWIALDGDKTLLFQFAREDEELLFSHPNGKTVEQHRAEYHALLGSMVALHRTVGGVAFYDKSRCTYVSELDPRFKSARKVWR